MPTRIGNKKQVRTLLVHTTPNPLIASCILDHYDDEARRDEDARNLQFENFPVGYSMRRKQQDPRGKLNVRAGGEG